MIEDQQGNFALPQGRQRLCELLTERTRKSRMRPRQLSYGQLDCLALLPFGVEDFDLKIWKTPL